MWYLIYARVSSQVSNIVSTLVIHPPYIFKTEDNDNDLLKSFRALFFFVQTEIFSHFQL